MYERLQPVSISIGQASHRWGIGKTKLYELIKAQEIRAVKVGARTLVDVHSGDEFFASLPAVGQLSRR